jgi:AcrR family transcriptional regulator
MTEANKNHNTKKCNLAELAGNLFIDKGYEETTVDDILEASGLSKGGFYHYFQSKEEVLLEVINNFIEKILAEVEPIIENKALGAMEKLRLFIEKELTIKKENMAFSKYFTAEKRSDFIIYKYNLSFAQKYVGPLVRIVEQGIAEGVFHLEFPYESVDILIRALATTISYVENELVNDHEKFYRYIASMKNIIAKTLGINSNEINLWDEELMNDFLDK